MPGGVAGVRSMKTVPYADRVEWPMCHALSAAHWDSEFSHRVLDLIRVLRQLREFVTQLHKGFCVGH